MQSNWTNIQIEDDILQFNANSRPLFHQCQAHDTRPLTPPMLGVESIRCGADAMYLVTRTSTMSGNTYTDHMCERHANEWRKALES